MALATHPSVDPYHSEMSVRAASVREAPNVTISVTVVEVPVVSISADVRSPQFVAGHAGKYVLVGESDRVSLDTTDTTCVSPAQS